MKFDYLAFKFMITCILIVVGFCFLVMIPACFDTPKPGSPNFAYALISAFIIAAITLYLLNKYL